MVKKIPQYIGVLTSDEKYANSTLQVPSYFPHIVGEEVLSIGINGNNRLTFFPSCFPAFGGRERGQAISNR